MALALTVWRNSTKMMKPPRKHNYCKNICWNEYRCLQVLSQLREMPCTPLLKKQSICLDKDIKRVQSEELAVPMAHQLICGSLFEGLWSPLEMQLWHKNGSNTLCDADCQCCSRPQYPPPCRDSALQIASSWLNPALASVDSLGGHHRSSEKNSTLSLRERRGSDYNRVCAFVGTGFYDSDSKNFSSRRATILKTWWTSDVFLLWSNRTSRLARSLPQPEFQVFAFDLDPDLEYKQVSERYLGAIKAWAEDAAAGGETSDCAFYLFVDDDAYIHMQAWEALLNRPGVDAGAIWYLGGSIDGGSGMFDGRSGVVFVHGATMVLSRGLIEQAANFIDTCLASYRLWENTNQRNFYGDVEVAGCLKMFGIYPRQLGSANGAGFLVENKKEDTVLRALKKLSHERRACILSVHKLSNMGLEVVHAAVQGSKSLRNAGNHADMLSGCDYFGDHGVSAELRACNPPHAVLDRAWWVAKSGKPYKNCSVHLNVNPFYGAAGKASAWPRVGKLEDCMHSCKEKAEQMRHVVPKGSPITLFYVWMGAVSAANWKDVCVCGPPTAKMISAAIDDQWKDPLDTSLVQTWKRHYGAVSGVCEYV
eukprot:INCI7232.6.p1 GENE.INCI7232.6~~INCI7232.6.p1  ORF type:complete len:592 (-),score=83.18 INCI7232.6:481-2256(-)